MDVAEGLFLHGQISLYVLVRCIHTLMPEPQGDDVEGMRSGNAYGATDGNAVNGLRRWRYQA